MTQKEFVNFPVKLKGSLHEALRVAAFQNRVSIHKLIQNTLEERWMPILDSSKDTQSE